MDKFQTNIKNISEVDFPKGLHGRIMRKLIFIRLKINFSLITTLLGVNLIVSGWHFWSRIVAMETISVIEALLDGFEISRDFLFNSLSTLSESFPFISASIFILNLIAVGYIIYFYSKLQKIDIKELQRSRN